MKQISFLIPCYYSEQTIENVVKEIDNEFPDSIGCEYVKEIVLVNDGSTDGTWDVICEITTKYPSVIGVNLQKNVGQDSACMAGYRFCHGDYIITLDDDGQNPPKDAKKLIKEIEKDYDVVFGKYQIKYHSGFRNFGSRFNDYSMVLFQGKPKNVTLCSYFIMNNSTREKMLAYKGKNPNIWALIVNATKNIGNVEIEHRPREIGQSTYTLSKLLREWLIGVAFNIRRKPDKNHPQYIVSEIWKNGSSISEDELNARNA